MIGYFLKYTLPQYYGLNPQTVVVNLSRHHTPFTEVDLKACNAAQAKNYPEGVFNKFEQICKPCEKIVLSVNNNNQDITVVQFEDYVNSLPAKIIDRQKRCDLLMTDGEIHHKIVFCDLCCYDDYYIEPNNGNQYPEGKRAEARKKMAASVEMLLGMPLLEHYILTFGEKICLFAYRSYSTQQPTMAQRGKAEANMQAMLTTASSVSGQIVSQDNVMNHNFTFVQNKYPSVYQW